MTNHERVPVEERWEGRSAEAPGTTDAGTRRWTRRPTVGTWSRSPRQAAS
jgi:hypothetical protein